MTDDNVVLWRGLTKLDLPADRVLKAVPIDEMESIIILGYHKDGSEYFASSLADGGDMIWLLERLKKQLLEMPDRMEERRN